MVVALFTITQHCKMILDPEMPQLQKQILMFSHGDRISNTSIAHKNTSWQKLTSRKIAFRKQVVL